MTWFRPRGKTPTAPGLQYKVYSKECCEQTPIMIGYVIMHLDEVKDGQTLCYIYWCSKIKLMCGGIYVIVWFIRDSKLQVRQKKNSRMV